MQARTTHENPSIPTDAIRLIIAVISVGSVDAKDEYSSGNTTNSMTTIDNNERTIPSFAILLIQSATSILSSTDGFWLLVSTLMSPDGNIPPGIY